MSSGVGPWTQPSSLLPVSETCAGAVLGACAVPGIQQGPELGAELGPAPGPSLQLLGPLLTWSRCP